MKQIDMSRKEIDRESGERKIERKTEREILREGENAREIEGERMV